MIKVNFFHFARYMKKNFFIVLLSSLIVFGACTHTIPRKCLLWEVNFIFDLSRSFPFNLKNTVYNNFAGLFHRLDEISENNNPNHAIQRLTLQFKAKLELFLRSYSLYYIFIPEDEEKRLANDLVSLDFHQMKFRVLTDDLHHGLFELFESVYSLLQAHYEEFVQNNADPDRVYRLKTFIESYRHDNLPVFRNISLLLSTLENKPFFYEPSLKEVSSVDFLIR